jgi:hypothetical protein
MAIPKLKAIDNAVNTTWQVAAVGGTSLAIDSNNSWQVRLRAGLIASPVLAFLAFNAMFFSIPLSISQLPGVVNDIHSGLLDAKTWLSDKLNERRERNNNSPPIIRPSDAPISFFTRIKNHFADSKQPMRVPQDNKLKI